ncbi:hypothetical protein ABW19_dt0201893 [Dactylella cylindrospora]|nr:hypothetical protein ABW19_dt0201893 [Dactylella cylindrospora]
MVTVAIAGGAGNIGGILAKAVKASPKHNVIVLSRKAPETQDPDAPVIAVDYEDVAALTEVFTKHNVNTVISVLALYSPAAGTAEVNLVKAAAQAAPTKRFIASDWSVPVREESTRQMPQKVFRDITKAELKKTDLDWTRVYFGSFIDYYAYPHIETSLPPFALFVDVANNKAVIPGTGDEPLTLIYSKDLATLVVAALDLPKWGEDTYIYSEKVTFNQIIKLVEEYRGTKFDITHNSLDVHLNGEPEYLIPDGLYPDYILGIIKSLMNNFGVWILEGDTDIPEEKNVRNKFPEIKTLGIKEALAVWAGK